MRLRRLFLFAVTALVFSNSVGCITFSNGYVDYATLPPSSQRSEDVVAIEKVSLTPIPEKNKLIVRCIAESRNSLIEETTTVVPRREKKSRLGCFLAFRP